VGRREVPLKCPSRRTTIISIALVQMAIDTRPIERFITEYLFCWLLGKFRDPLGLFRLRNVVVAVSSLERFVLQSVKRDTK